MNLLIFPGGGNPDISEKYSNAYSLISSEASKRGYDYLVNDLRWPGHTTVDNYKESDALNFPSAVETALEKLSLYQIMPLELSPDLLGVMLL